MAKVAFVFPGQGSQSVGMGKALCESYSVARKVFEEADKALGSPISDIVFNGPAAELDRTENTQPALLVSSIACLEALSSYVRIDPAYYAGHSLGEYTALTAARALDFDDAVRLVRLRGLFMQEAVPPGMGKMCAILGLGVEAVEAACAEASTNDGKVVAANVNSPEQIVISGAAEAVDRAAELLRQRGAKRVLPLQVSVPSHSPLMASAATRLAKELSNTRLSSPRSPVVTNVEAMPESDPVRLKALLERQLTSPVRWVDTIRRMKADGVDLVVEIGPGKVLSGLVKRIDKDLAAINVSEPSDMDKAVEAIKAVGGR